MVMKIIAETQSICPVCHHPLKAQYVEENGKVFMRKTCLVHGAFESNIAECAEAYKEWINHLTVNVPSKQSMTEGVDGQCPLHCGICDRHLQTACCVLIDVTERCNQHCPYCFAKAESDISEEPSLDEIARKYDYLLALGEVQRPFNIHLSGGEPTVRDDLPEIIKMGREKGFGYIQINTNGRRLALEEQYAKVLKEAGASVIYLQFDGTDDEIYKKIRGEAIFEIKKKAIENCRKARIPVVLVPTIVKNVNLYNIGDMLEFLLQNISIVKGIHFQPVSFFGRHPEKLSKEDAKWLDYENRVTMFDVMRQVEEQTGGKFKYEDFYSTLSGHPLCGFYGTYRKQKDETIISLIDHEAKASGISCCSTDSMDIIKKNRDFVVNKWHLPDDDDCCCSCESNERKQQEVADCCESETMSFDQFIADMRNNMFTISGMAFQDESNLDAERLRRCRIQVLSPDDRLIPFCAYNSLYRK